jgi:four helix bundle protein
MTIRASVNHFKDGAYFRVSPTPRSRTRRNLEPQFPNYQVTQLPNSGDCGVDRATASSVSEQSERLKQRARRFVLDVLELIKLLPRDEPGPTVKRQLTKATTSVDMNYRAACRARSHAEFTARIGVVAEEADESASWLDLIVDARLLDAERVRPLQQEAHELEAIFSASAGTARRKARSRAGT